MSVVEAVVILTLFGVMFLLGLVAMSAEGYRERKRLRHRQQNTRDQHDDMDP